MIRTARAAHPDIDFQSGDMRALPLQDHSLAGIAAFYSIIHFPRQEVTSVLKEMRRVLQPGAPLLAFHRGDEVRHFEELWGQPILLDFVFFGREEMEGYLRDTGFVIDEMIERAPYPEVEAQTQRVYIFAHK